MKTITTQQLTALQFMRTYNEVLSIAGDRDFTAQEILELEWLSDLEKIHIVVRDILLTKEQLLSIHKKTGERPVLPNQIGASVLSDIEDQGADQWHKLNQEYIKTHNGPYDYKWANGRDTELNKFTKNYHTKIISIIKEALELKDEQI
jgi:hypothetical protein